MYILGRKEGPVAAARITGVIRVVSAPSERGGPPLVAPGFALTVALTWIATGTTPDKRGRTDRPESSLR